MESGLNGMTSANLNSHRHMTCGTAAAVSLVSRSFTVTVRGQGVKSCYCLETGVNHQTVSDRTPWLRDYCLVKRVTYVIAKL